MSFDHSLFSRKVHSLMRTQGYTPDSIASATNIASNRLNEILNISDPTGDEILILSELFCVDFKHFISNEETDQLRKAEKLFRSNEEVLNTRDVRLLTRILYMASFSKQLTDAKGVITYAFHPSLNSTKADIQGKSVAHQLRDKLGDEQQFDNSDLYQVPRKLGIQVFRQKFTNTRISGILMNSAEAGKVIVVNQLEDVFRQNFTLLHELCHALLDDDQEYSISYIGTKRDPKEIRADNFAASFLLPDGYIDQFKGCDLKEELFLKIAKKMYVNPETLSIRLRERGVIASSQQEKLKELRIPKAEKADVELLGLSANGLKQVRILQENGFSFNYLRLLYDAYVDSHISFLKLCEMLFMTYEDATTLFSEMGWRLDVK